MQNQYPRTAARKVSISDYNVERRAYGQYQSYETDLLKNAFLLSLYDQNQVLPPGGLR